MKNSSVTVTLGMSVNDVSAGNTPEFEIPDTKITWRDVPYEAVLAFEALFMDSLRMVHDEASSWGSEAIDIMEEAGGDKEEAIKRNQERLKKRRERRKKARR